MKPDLRSAIGFDSSGKNAPVLIRITYEYISEQGNIVKQQVEYKDLEAVKCQA